MREPLCRELCWNRRLHRSGDASASRAALTLRGTVMETIYLPGTTATEATLEVRRRRNGSGSVIVRRTRRLRNGPGRSLSNEVAPARHEADGDPSAGIEPRRSREARAQVCRRKVLWRGRTHRSPSRYGTGSILRRGSTLRIFAAGRGASSGSARLRTDGEGGRRRRCRHLSPCPDAQKL
jgi:hypothetical protein